MSRAHGDTPQFDRLIEELERAREEWRKGNRGKAEAMLKVVSSIAYAEAKERGPHDPMPEAEGPR
jgi:hypothetical protein